MLPLLRILPCVRDVYFHSAAEMEQAAAGKYKEKAMEFLQSHWQASALKSLAGSKVQLFITLAHLPGHMHSAVHNAEALIILLCYSSCMRE